MPFKKKYNNQDWFYVTNFFISSRQKHKTHTTTNGKSLDPNNRNIFSSMFLEIGFMANSSLKLVQSMGVYIVDVKFPTHTPHTKEWTSEILQD